MLRDILTIIMLALLALFIVGSVYMLFTGKGRDWRL